MKKLIGILLFITTIVFAQDASRILTGSAQPPLPFNIITQPGFENRTLGWSVTGGTFTTTSTVANLARGRYSAQWTLPVSASAGTLLQSDSVTIPAGLYGRDCRGMLLYKGTAAANGTLTLEAYDGTNILGTLALPDSTYYTQKQTTTFTCPTSGSIRLRVRNTVTGSATPTVLYFDEAVIADANSVGIAGAITNVGTFGTVPDDKGASSSGTTLTIQPADATRPGAITAGTQTIGGNKTLAGSTTLSALSTGIVHSGVGGALTSSTIVDADVNAAAAIVDTKLATISTASKVSNSATTATASNTNSSIVARDGSGNFTASSITSNLVGNVTGSLTGPSVTLNGAAGAGFVSLPSQSVAPTAPASGFKEYADSVGRKSWIRASDGFARTWDSTLTGNRIYNLPDASTTIVGTDVVQTLTNKSISGEQINSGTVTSARMSSNGLFPLTTKGDLYTFDSSVNRLPVGTNNFVLMADSAQATGLKWGAPASSGSGMVIGQPVTGSSGNRLLYSDGSGNLADSANLTYTSGKITATTASTDGKVLVATGTNSAGSDTGVIYANATNSTASPYAGIFSNSIAGANGAQLYGQVSTANSNSKTTVSYYGFANIDIGGGGGGGVYTNFYGAYLSSSPGTVSGDNYALYASGNSYFGGNISTAGTIIPTDNGLKDIGSTSFKYRRLYANEIVQSVPGINTANIDLVNSRLGSPSGTYALDWNARVLRSSGVTRLDWSGNGTGVKIQGTQTNDDATSGDVGEEIFVGGGTISSYAATGTWSDYTSISLTAGDWDVTATVYAVKNGSTSTVHGFFIGTVAGNNTTGYDLSVGNFAENDPPTAANYSGSIIANLRKKLATTTTLYLKTSATFSVGTPQRVGWIKARRVR